MAVQMGAKRKDKTQINPLFAKARRIFTVDGCFVYIDRAKETSTNHINHCVALEWLRKAGKYEKKKLYFFSSNVFP